MYLYKFLSGADTENVSHFGNQVSSISIGLLGFRTISIIENHHYGPSKVCQMVPKQFQLTIPKGLYNWHPLGGAGLFLNIFLSLIFLQPKKNNPELKASLSQPFPWSPRGAAFRFRPSVLGPVNWKLQAICSTDLCTVWVWFQLRSMFLSDQYP